MRFKNHLQHPIKIQTTLLKLVQIRFDLCGMKSEEDSINLKIYLKLIQPRTFLFPIGKSIKF